MYRIIYFSNNQLHIIVPNSNIDLNTLAKKYVPKNTAYKIIPINEIPSDRAFRDAWQYDFSDPDGYGQGALV